MIGAVVLAAGASTRLGRPKQLLRVGESTLLRQTVECALGAGLDPVLVVLGYRAAALRPELSGLPVTVVLNREWKRGLSASVRKGIRELAREQPRARAALLLVCDQPRLSVSLLRRMLRANGGAEDRLVACEYAGTLGVPALIGRTWFPEVARIRGDRGARGLLARHEDRVVRVAWPDGVLDVDLPQDADRAGPTGLL